MQVQLKVKTFATCLWFSEGAEKYVCPDLRGQISSCLYVNSGRIHLMKQLVVDRSTCSTPCGQQMALVVGGTITTQYNPFHNVSMFYIYIDNEVYNMETDCSHGLTVYNCLNFEECTFFKATTLFRKR